MKAHNIYNKLIQIIPDIETRTKAGKSVVDPEGGLMDLNLDILNREGNLVRIALAHYYKQNGDLISDPDMEMIVNTKLKAVNAMTFQDTFGYQTAELGDNKFNIELVGQLNEFLDTWLQNCIDQGHKID